MAWPFETYVNQIADPQVRAEFIQLYSLFQGYLSVEHKESGRHGAIHADSVTSTGAISGTTGTFIGDVGVQGNGSYSGGLAVGGYFIHQGLLFQNEVKNIAIGTFQELGPSDMAFEMNLRVTSVSGLGPSLRGIPAPNGVASGSYYRFFNCSGSSFVLEHNVGSVAAEHILTPNGKNITVYDGDSFDTFYDPTTTKWRARITAVATEVGTWTPVLTFGGGSTGLTYSTQEGQYTRIGNIVTAEFRIALSAKGASTGTAQIDGLPYAAAKFPSVVLDCAAGMSGLTGAPMIVVSSTSLFPLQTAAAGRTQLSDTSFTNASDIRAGITYRV